MEYTFRVEKLYGNFKRAGILVQKREEHGILVQG
jgi:hypothetical protein